MEYYRLIDYIFDDRFRSIRYALISPCTSNVEYSRIYAVQLLTDWLNLFMTWDKGLPYSLLLLLP